jgi:hypothetical protein
MHRVRFVSACLLAGVSYASLIADVPQLVFSATPVRSVLTLALPPAQTNPLYTMADNQFGLSNGRTVAFGDFNGDGLTDLVVKPAYLHFKPTLPPRFWINTGGGRFEDQTSAVVDGDVPDMGVATSTFVTDFNRDGRDDVFYVDSGLEDQLAAQGFDGGRNTVFLSQPNGRLKNTTATSLPLNERTFNHVSSMADIDGNGAMDLFISRLGSARIAGNGAILVLNDGSGRFSETIAGLPQAIAYLPTATGLAVADRHPAGSTGACDLDGDQRTDLVTASYSNNFYAKNVRAFQQATPGQFVEKFRVPIPPGIVTLAASINQSPGAAGIACADLNGDNRNDLVIHWENFSFIQILRNQGNFQFTDVTLDWFGSWSSAFETRSGTRPINQVTLRDVNGDGTRDFVPQVNGSWTPEMLWNGGFARLNDGTGRLEPMRYRPDSSTGTVADLSRVLGCFVAQCPFFPVMFDATGDGTVDLILLEIESMKSRDLPYREDRVAVYTFEGRVR